MDGRMATNGVQFQGIVTRMRRWFCIPSSASAMLFARSQCGHRREMHRTNLRVLHRRILLDSRDSLVVEQRAAVFVEATS